MKSTGKISFGSAVLMSINIIVGAGIFVHPQRLTKLAGGLSFLSWPLAGLVLFPIIWGIIQASKLFPGEGGFYNYCSQGLGKIAGFIAQWSYLLGYLGTVATITAVLRSRLVSQFDFTFVSEHPFIFNALLIIFFSLLNLISIEMISKIQSRLTIVKLLPLFFVIGVFAWYWNPTISYDPSLALNLGMTLPSAIFAYFGFEACCSLGHLLKDGTQQVGKVVVTAFLATVAIYMFFHFGLLNIMGVDGLIERGVEAFPQAMGLGATWTTIISAAVIGCILVSFCNTIFGVSLTNIMNIFTIAKQRLIVGHKFLGYTNGIDAPLVAIVVHGIVLWAFLAAISSITILNALTVIGVTTTFVLMLLAVMAALCRKGKCALATTMIPGLCSCAILYYYCWVDISPEPLTSLLYISPFIAAMVVGFALYAIQQMKPAR